VLISALATGLYPDITDNSGVLVTIGVRTHFDDPIEIQGDSALEWGIPNGLYIGGIPTVNSDGLSIWRQFNPSAAAGQSYGQETLIESLAGNLENIDRLVGGYFEAAHRSSGTMTTLSSIELGSRAGSGAGITTHAALIYGTTIAKNVTATITNVYGIRLEDQTVGVNNYAIKTGLGLVRFGDNVSPGSDDLAALGTTALGWSDIHFATGAVQNYANGNALITHSSGLLTVSAADFMVNKSSATSFIVGPNGATNPAFVVVTNTASGATGLSITNAASGSGVTLTALGGTNEAILFLSKGSSPVVFGSTSAVGGVAFDGTTAGNSSMYVRNSLRMWAGGSLGWSSTNNPTDATDTFFLRGAANKIYVGTSGGGTLVANTIGIGVTSPTYGLHLAPTSGLTAAQTAFFQDATASTGQTLVRLKGGAVAGTIFEVQDSGANVKMTLTDAGLLKTISLYATGDGGGIASTTALTNATNATVTNAYVVAGGQAATTQNTGWLKFFVGTNAVWLPYWQNATP
jgi:hypothetical protein